MKAPRLYRRARVSLGTLIEIRCVSASAEEDARAAAACHAAFACAERIHAAMSRQQPDSDIARFNAAGAGSRLVVDAWTWRVLQAAVQLQQQSRGLFDISLGSSLQPFRLHAGAVLEKTDAAAELDVGGIAKGFAVDVMLLSLRRHGLRSACVNAGGDLRVMGAVDWPVQLQGRPGQAPRFLQLRQGSVASSGYTAGRSLHKGDVLMDPHTGAPRVADIAVSVAAPRCLLADALTKVVALSGDAGHPLLAACHAQAWIS